MEWWFFVVVLCIVFYMVNVLLLLGRLREQSAQQQHAMARMMEALESLAWGEDDTAGRKQSLRRRGMAVEDSEYRRSF